VVSIKKTIEHALFTWKYFVLIENKSSYNEF
jgi:hypothetical protein